MDKYKVQCDYSGQIVWSYETRMTWDGKRVYYKYWEPRQPQDISPKPAADRQTVPNPRARNIVDYTAAASTEYLNTQAGVNLSGLEFSSVYPGTLGTDYFDVPIENIDYWTKTLNAKYIRIPFRAERMFTAVDGDIVTDYFNLVKAIADRVLANGSIPIIDYHNLSEFFISGIGYELGSAQYTTAHFVEHWRKLSLSTAFGYDSRIEFDLMNEPSSSLLTAAQWVTTLNSAIAAIRGEGASNLLHIEPQGAGGLLFLFQDDNAFTLQDIVDSQSNWILHLHIYFNINYGGFGDFTTPSDIHAMRYYPAVIDFVRDLRATFPFLKVHLGELGAGVNRNGDLSWQNFHQFWYENRDICRSFTTWGGGGSWPDSYELRTDPRPINGGAFLNPTNLLISANAEIKNGSRPNIGVDFTTTEVSSSILSISRASTGYALTKAGVWQNFTTDTFRRTDRGVLVEDTATNRVARDFLTGSSEVNAILASGQADFVGGTNGYTLTESGVGSLSHYISTTATSELEVDTDYVVQYLINFDADFWTWIQARTPDTFSVYNNYERFRDVQSGTWKKQILRISRDSATSVIRTRIGFQPDDTPASASVPDAYTKASPERVISVCCPMIVEGNRSQSPIFGASANETRQKDDISIVNNALSYMQGDEFTIVIEVGELDYLAEVANILSINGTVALRKNADNSVGGDVISTLSTAVAVDGPDSFLYPRRVALSYKAVTESVLTPMVTIAAEGLGDPVTATGSFAAITAAKIEPFGGYLRKIRIYDRYIDGQELINTLETI